MRIIIFVIFVTLLMSQEVFSTQIITTNQAMDYVRNFEADTTIAFKNCHLVNSENEKVYTLMRSTNKDI